MKFQRIILFISSIVLSVAVKAREASNIGSYNIGFNYSHVTGDNVDSNSFSVGSNLAFHPNFSTRLGFSYTNADADPYTLNFGGTNFTYKEDASQISGGVSLIFHNRFQSSQSFAIDPFLQIGLGVNFLEVDGTVTSGFSFVPYSASFTTIPVILNVGSEFVINNFVIITPSLGVLGYLSDDNLNYDASFIWGLSADFMLSDHFSLGFGIGGTDGNFDFGFGSKYHF
jgi:hypothetical protein